MVISLQNTNVTVKHAVVFIIINFGSNKGTQMGADYENDNNVPY